MVEIITWLVTLKEKNKMTEMFVVWWEEMKSEVVINMICICLLLFPVSSPEQTL